MLIGRNRLRRELPANPIGVFRQHDPHAVAERCERSSNAAHATADHGNIAIEFQGACHKSWNKDQGSGGGQKMTASG
jgi:hypothetical protein